MPKLSFTCWQYWPDTRPRWRDVEQCRPTAPLGRERPPDAVGDRRDAGQQPQAGPHRGPSANPTDATRVRRPAAPHRSRPPNASPQPPSPAAQGGSGAGASTPREHDGQRAGTQPEHRGQRADLTYSRELGPSTLHGMWFTRTQTPARTTSTGWAWVTYPIRQRPTRVQVRQRASPPTPRGLITVDAPPDVAHAVQERSARTTSAGVPRWTDAIRNRPTRTVNQCTGPARRQGARIPVDAPPRVVWVGS
jgi:hypothetical protein